MTKYTIDSQYTNTTDTVTREDFLKFIRENDCAGLIRVGNSDCIGSWSPETGLCFTDKDFDWEHCDDYQAIEPECIAERLGTEGPEITAWNIIWSDEGYPIARAVVGEWK